MAFIFPDADVFLFFFERERETETEMSSTFPYFHSSNETANLVTWGLRGKEEDLQKDTEKSQTYKQLAAVRRARVFY